MPRRADLALVSTLLCLAACSSSKEVAAPPADPRTEQDRRMQWWREARFGMFVHWGLYAIPAGEWHGDTSHAEWIRDTARIPLAEYEALRERFEPRAFDPEAWARAAQDAGMRYVVITSKHHDGFALYDSKQGDWDVGATPFRRDVLAELARACARHDLRFCTYHSIMDWHHPDYLPRRGWEERSAAGADFARYEQYLHAQVREIVTRYHPAVMWFDGEWEPTWNHERGRALFELCRELDPSMIVNNRVDARRGGMGGFSAASDALGDFATPEQEIPATGVPGVDWETCMTLNDHWGFNAHDDHWKSKRELLRNLCDIASKGGNFLLNVGPRADGSFPRASLERLAAIGAWMRTNGAAIHGTRASPFAALPFGRATQKDDGDGTLLYLHVFDWPASRELVLPGLANDVVRAATLLQPNTALVCERRGADLAVKLPAAAPDPDVSVVVVRLAGALVVHAAPRIRAASPIFVDRLEVELEAGTPAVEVRYTLDGREPSLNSAISSGRIELDATATVKARRFQRGKPLSALAEVRFEKVVPAPPLARRGAMAGLECSVYPGEFERLPDFDRELAATRNAVPSPALPPGHAQEREARRFTGFVDVPASDVWTVALTSDDGAQLWIDGKCVVDHDGLHVASAKTGSAALAAGPHALAVTWARLGKPAQPLGDAAYSH